MDCNYCLYDGDVVPTGGVRISPSKILCTQTGGDESNINCDKAVIVSDNIEPVNNGDGSGPS